MSTIARFNSSRLFLTAVTFDEDSSVTDTEMDRKRCSRMSSNFPRTAPENNKLWSDDDNFSADELEDPYTVAEKSTRTENNTLNSDFVISPEK